jgi:hypothetical protein
VDPVGVEHALEHRVERAGAQAQLGAALLDVLEDGVAVALAAGERQQDVELGRRERQVAARDRNWTCRVCGFMANTS